MALASGFSTCDSIATAPSAFKVFISSLVGVFVAQFDSGVRVAITGGGSGVFRHAGLEQALSKSFIPEAAASVKIDASDLSTDLHATAAYRANLIGVLTQRAVAKALAWGLAPIPALLMGIFTACLGGIIRDLLAGEPSIIMRPELYVTASALAASLMVGLSLAGVPSYAAGALATAAGLLLRGGALLRGWELPIYRR
mgnify:CR=1 FL=1